MRLAKYRKKLEPHLIQATLVFFTREDEILLANKKRGFGIDKLNGTGGKQKIGETIEQTAKREAYEEVRMTPNNLEKVATIKFYFAESEMPGQIVTIFLSDSWDGEPEETEEMNPDWYKVVEIPYDRMWEDDKHWLPLVLEGKKIEAEFLFDSSQRLVDFEIVEK